LRAFFSLEKKEVFGKKDFQKAAALPRPQGILSLDV